ncbi:putative F-box protein [Cardiosporidium cionae]|uniref:F-box protein n=1 Tax=Cardiosporidium cionae TaxID=476202 RepID=A0ABQ7JCM0_9APIC|nr:putative F-box protein [Cardiosporidium cionae]|eukprot:KAF8821726.1 putative F-box protein [Cardiosporidium cionae]
MTPQDSQNLLAIPFWSIPLSEVGSVAVLAAALPLLIPFFTIRDVFEGELYLVCKTWLRQFVGQKPSDSLFSIWDVAFEGEKEPLGEKSSSARPIMTSKQANSRLPSVSYFLGQLTRSPLTCYSQALMHLSFEFCAAFTREHIQLLPSTLRSLNLNGCQSIDDTALRLLAKRCPRLQHLQLYWNVHITDAGLMDLLKSAPPPPTEKYVHGGSDAMAPILRHGFLSLNLSGCKRLTDQTIHALFYHQRRGYYPAMAASHTSSSFHDRDTLPPPSNPSSLEDAPTDPSPLSVTARLSHSSSSLFWPSPPERMPLSIGAHSCSAMSYSLPSHAAVGLLELDLTKCLYISEAGIRMVCESMLHLRKLILYGCNHLKPTAFTQLHLLSHLQILDLCGTLISDESLVRMLDICKVLRCIDLSWCLSISDESLIAFANHPTSWEWISFHGNRFFSLPPFEVFLNSPSSRYIHSLDIQGCVGLSKYQHAEGIATLREKLPSLLYLHLHH